MSKLRIYLSKEDDEFYDNQNQEFVRVPVVKVRAKDQEEAEAIAEHISDEFGEDISLKDDTIEGDME